MESEESLIQVLHQAVDSNVKSFADSKQGAHRDRPTGFDLLPVPCRKTVANHVLLAVSSLFPQVSDSLAESTKKLLLIRHQRVL